MAIAGVLATQPEILALDEPTTFLDPPGQRALVRLLRELPQAKILITHDIAVARYMADRIAVMYLGRIVEEAPTEEVIAHPTHPYTRALLSAVPVPDPAHEYTAVPIRGELPSPIDLPSGCRFRTRCLFAKEICATTAPPRIEVAPGHVAECHFATDIYSGVLVEPPMAPEVPTLEHLPATPAEDL